MFLWPAPHLLFQNERLTIIHEILLYVCACISKTVTNKTSHALFPLFN